MANKEIVLIHNRLGRTRYNRLLTTATIPCSINTLKGCGWKTEQQQRKIDAKRQRRRLANAGNKEA